MKGDACRWVQNSISSGGGMRALGAADCVRVESHIDNCLKCRGFVHVSEALTGMATDLSLAPLPPLMERRMILAALDGRMPARPRNERLLIRFALVGASAAAISAIVLAIILGFFSKQTAQRPSGIAPAIATFSQSQDRPSASSRESILGSYTFPSESAVMPLTLAESKVWGSKETALSVLEQTPSRTRIRLEQGKIVAEVNDVGLGSRFMVLTPSALVEVRGTIFSVEVALNGAETVRVLEGTVAVTDFTGGSVHLLSTNQQIIVGDGEVSAASRQAVIDDARLAGMRAIATGETDAPTTAEATAQTQPPALQRLGIQVRNPDESNDGADSQQGTDVRDRPPSGASVETDISRNLLREAKKHRENQRFALAKQTYLKLIDRHPESSAAANATVALAQMELGVLGDKAAALGHFEAYLKKYPSGVLAEEAWIGRMRALSRLNRLESVISVAGAYLKKRPLGTVAPEMLLRRGDAYVKRQDCEAALRDFVEVNRRWPNSQAARRAQASALACKERP